MDVLNFGLAIAVLGIGLTIVGGMGVLQSRNAQPGWKRKAFVFIGILAVVIGVCVTIGGLFVPVWFRM